MTTVKVIFESDDVQELKLKISEYSLVHLGLNFKEMAKPFNDKPANQPGVSEETTLGDGSVRLHNPSYPGAMKRKPGRQPGWRKIKPAAESGADMATDSPSTVMSALSPEEVAGPLQEPSLQPEISKSEAAAAIHKLNDIKGFESCLDVLESFGAKHLNDIPPEKYSDLINLCEQKYA